MDAKHLEPIFAWIGGFVVSFLGVAIFCYFLAMLVDVVYLQRRRKRPACKAVAQATQYRMTRFGEAEEEALVAVERRIAQAVQQTLLRRVS
jgi:hypothetical protein